MRAFKYYHATANRCASQIFHWQMYNKYSTFTPPELIFVNRSRHLY